jgi:four helix bundle protein
VQDFHQLNVWKKAHSLVLRVYKVSNELPASENFGLVLNLRRSAVVIARSIAEGAGRDSDAEFATELKKARAAGHDLEYNLLLCRDLGFIPEPLHAETQLGSPGGAQDDLRPGEANARNRRDATIGRHGFSL